MEKFLDVIAPASRWGFWVKSFLLVMTYTLFDMAVRQSLATQLEITGMSRHVVTFLIGAPFALFVMWIMARQRCLKEQLKFMSSTDSLTGLSNRACFLTSAAQGIDAGQSGAALMIDLDYFKRVNDTYGHYFGDLTLRRVAEHLKSATRSGDIVGRIGGEEFAIFLPDTSAHEARQIAKRICTPVRVTSTNLDGSDNISIDVTMSVGGVMAQQDASLVDLLRHADEAMYQAKKSGRARVVFHELRENQMLASV